jgi:chromodomain-helicase-DNA-binding protein 4
MWWKGKNAILADEMGLGKTIQIIAFLAVLQEEQNIWPFLIVVPHSTVPNWLVCTSRFNYSINARCRKREIQTWAPALRVVSYYGSDSARKLSVLFYFPVVFIVANVITYQRKYELFGTNYELKCHIVVTSYHTPISDSAILHKIPWQGLIVDEGQRLKNDSTLLYTELQRYKFNHKVLLSGTPLQNNPRELFNLLQFLEPENIDAEQLEEEFGELTSETVPRLHTLIR